MYVAVTRARERLYLLHAQERMLYGEYKTNAPSQFLEELPEKVIEKNYTSRGSSSAGMGTGSFSGGGNGSSGSRGGSRFFNGGDDSVRLVGMDDEMPNGRSRVSGGKINMGSQWSGDAGAGGNTGRGAGSAGTSSAGFSSSGSSSSGDSHNVRLVPMEDAEPAGAFGPQDRVSHPLFGEGIVLNIVGGIVTVVFENPSIGTKKLAISIAPLRRVE